MSNPLTTGIIRDIFTNPDDLPKNPVLQVLGLKKIQPTQGTGADRYRLVLSDGEHVHTCAMLATQLNDMVTNGELEANAVVRLDKFICNTIQETRKVLIVLELSVLQRGCDVPSRFGQPKAFDPNAAQNGTSSNNARGSTQNTGGTQRGPSSGQNQQQANKGNSTSPGQNRFQNNASRGSNQPVQRNQSGPTVYPISSLNPYQNRWTICARVTSKSNIRTWSNSRGEGRLFNVELIDESGEIRATCFTDLVDKFYDMLEANKVYYISKGSMRPANKKYSSIKNDYELHFTNDTTIEPCTSGNENLPTLQFNFTEIARIEDVPKDNLIDLVGVCSNIGDVTEITTRATNKQVSKRELTLIDETASVSCTLWGADAENFEKYVGTNPVIAIKGAKVSDFGGRSLSLLSSSTMQVNPDSVTEAFKLRGWYDSGGHENINSISGQRSVGFGSDIFKNTHQIKAENLGMSEKPDYFSIVAAVGYFKKDNCLYQACPKEDCNKKVILDGDHFRCEKCNQTYPNFKYRLILRLNLTDCVGEQWVTCFQETAEAILGRKSDEIGQLKAEDESAYDQLFADKNFSAWTFRLRAIMDNFHDEARLKCTVASVAPIDYVKDANRLIEEIQKMQ